MSQIIFHIGLPKTSTTLIQNRFSEITAPNYIFNPPIFDELVELLLLYSKNEIAFNSTELQRFKNHVDKYVKENGSSHIFCSDERLACDGYGLDEKTSYERKFELLKYLIPDVKLLLVLREHKSWIVSLYKQSVQQGNFQSFDNFIHHGHNIVNKLNIYQTGELPKLTIRNTRFETLIIPIIANFGRQNLILKKYEIISRDYDKFFCEICDLVGIDDSKLMDKDSNVIVYRSLSGLSIKLILIICHYLKRIDLLIWYCSGTPLDKSSTTRQNNFFQKHITWVTMRGFFQDYLDKLVYLDLRFTKSKMEVLQNYQDCFDTYEDLY